MDIWFARTVGAVWFSWAEPGHPPAVYPQRAKSVKEAVKWLNEAGIDIGQVGIADAGMLGLADN